MYHGTPCPTGPHRLLHWEKFRDVNNAFKRCIGILVDEHNSTGILTSITRYPRQNTCWNISIYYDPDDSLKCFVHVAEYFSMYTVYTRMFCRKKKKLTSILAPPTRASQPISASNSVCTHGEKSVSISFHIEWDMIVVTVFISIENQMEFHLVQNRKENCHHDHIPFNLKGNVNIVFSV